MVEDNLCDPHLVLRTVNGIIVKAAIARAEAPINRAFGVVVFIIIVVQKITLMIVMIIMIGSKSSSKVTNQNDYHQCCRWLPSPQL